MSTGIPDLCKAVLCSACLAVVSPASAQGRPGFTEVTAAAGLTFVYGPSADTPNIAQPGGGTEGDFNGDAWPDLFLVGGGLISDALFMNDGDGTFTDTAATAGFTQMYRGIGANAAAVMVRNSAVSSNSSAGRSSTRSCATTPRCSCG